MRNLFTFIGLFGLLTMGPTASAQQLTVTDTIFDRQAHEADFAFGADLSGVPMYAANSWLDKNGVQKDIMQIMKEQGINSCRLRVWTVNSGGSSKQEVVNMAKRAKAKGMSVMIDFHYSDTWADPGFQTIPSAWTDHSVEALATNVYNHTYDVLKAVVDAGVTPRWVQVGNETKRGMLYPVGQTNKGGSVAFAKFVQSGYNAVKAIDSTMQVIVHLPDGHDNSLYRSIFDGLKKNGAKWDIIGMSAYPRWSHLDGPTMITKVMSNIKDLKARYGTPCMVVETGHYPTEAVIGNQYIVGLIDKMLKNGDLTGCYYWAPETLWGYNMGAWDTETKRPTVMMDAFLGVKHTVVSWILKNSVAYPKQNEVVPLQGDFTIKADVKHIRNRQVNVTFFVDGIKKGIVNTEPYELTVNDIDVGAHQVWTEAKDAAGNSLESKVVDFTMGESQAMVDPICTNVTEKGGTMEWGVNFKETGKYMLQFNYSSSDRVRGVYIYVNNDSITREFFRMKDYSNLKVEIDITKTGTNSLKLKASNNGGIPTIHSFRVFPLEGQQLPEEVEGWATSINTLPTAGESEMVEIYSLTGVLVGRMTREEAGLPESWNGQPRVVSLPNSVGGTPNIVRKQRLK